MEEKIRKIVKYEIKREGFEDVLYLDYSKETQIPDIAESFEVMSEVVESLIDNANASRIVLISNKNYNYDLKKTALLIELAHFYSYLINQEEILNPNRISFGDQRFVFERNSELNHFLFLLKGDPILAYYELKKMIIANKVLFNDLEEDSLKNVGKYVILLEDILQKMEKLEIFILLRNFFEIFDKGSREIYKKIFVADVIPRFSFSRLVLDFPENAKLIKQYQIKGEDYDFSNVMILEKEGSSKYIYYLVPPENSLSDEESFLVNLARNVLVEHQPKAEEFVDTLRTRRIFFNVARDLVRDLAKTQNFFLDYQSINKLAVILVRQTIGFGLIEVLLQDEKLQDISLNAPVSKNKIFARHNDYGTVEVNILPSEEDVNSWATKFRLISGRPLDEANPILDTQLEIGQLRARVAVIQQPLSPDGLSYSLRRHRDSPWTLPLFIKNKMINSFCAGLLSFLIDGSRTLLVAGTRSSGKTSLLGSLMLEINPKVRVIVIEDTLELPVEYLRKIGYDIVRMKVRSALVSGSNEISADDGIRTSLRMGDSSLIVGEVRSTEAQALYEAMRVGALANVVAGTIHGASPYGVFDRVVNDLNVPATSFKATDIIVVANPIKTSDGLHSKRRVISVSEVRKHWSKDPQDEGGFVDLMNYDVEKDELFASEDLINGDSEIVKSIAGNVAGWAGNWDAVYDNILLRAKIKQEIVKISEKFEIDEILEAKFNSLSNYMFYKFSEEVRKEKGLPVGDIVFRRWNEWVLKEVEEKRKIFLETKD